MSGISVKRGYMALLVIQAAVIGICAFGLVRVFYNTNTNQLYSQASTVLDLYILNCENKLGLVEKWSYNILADVFMQEELEAVDSNGPGSYDSYLLKQQVKSRLTNYLFSIDNCEAICFIANDGSQLIGAYSSASREFPDGEVDRLREIAAAQNGGASWTRSSDGGKLYMVRTIKEVRSGQFRDLGVLVLTCSARDIFRYDFSQNYAYNPVVVVSDAEGTLHTSQQDFAALSPAAAGEGRSVQNFVNIDSLRYYVTSHASAHTGWQYQCYISNSDMLYSVNLLNTQIIAALVVVLFLSLLASLRFSFSITAPIERLSKEIEEVRRGKYQPVQKQEATEARPEAAFFQIREVEALGQSFHVMVDEINYLINDVYRKQIMIKDMQYKILRSQINPHFLNNTLDTINSLAKRQGQAEISLMVQSLSKMLRTALTKRDLHTLREELDLLGSYIAIQKVRFEERLDFSMEGMEAFEAVSIPKLTLQPLVENSIKYGLERFARVCTIRLRGSAEENSLRLEVADNGPGMEPGFVERILSGEIAAGHSGLGIKNIHERIRLAFGEDYGVVFESPPQGGTIASIRIPLEPAGEAENPLPAGAAGENAAVSG